MSEEFKRVLRMRDLIAFAIMTMVPIAPMGIYGIVAELSNGFVPMSYLIASIGMFFTAWAYGQFAYRFPKAGSVYAYVTETAGSNVGFFAGWSILLDYFLVPALVILVSGLWLEAETGIPMLAWALLFNVSMAILNILGVELTARASMALFLFEMAVLVIFSGAAIVKILTTPGLSFTLTPFYDPATFSIHAVISGAALAVLSYLGFDMMTTLAEETVEARRVVSRAVLLVVPLITSFFVLQTYLAAVIHPGSSFDNPDIAFYSIAYEAGGKVVQFLTMLGTVLAWGLGDTLAAQASVSRILYAMGKEGHVPRIFAKVHPKYRTPYVSTIFVATITMILLYVLTLADLTSLVNFGALTAFILMHVSLTYRFIRIESKPVYAIIPIVGFMVTAAIWYNLPDLAKEIGLAWIAIGILYLAYVTKGFKVKTRLPVG